MLISCLVMDECAMLPVRAPCTCTIAYCTSAGMYSLCATHAPQAFHACASKASSKRVP